MSNPRKARGLYKRWMNNEYDDTNIPRTTKWRRQNFDSSENITSDRLNTIAKILLRWKHLVTALIYMVSAMS